jgi:hypothetical protein
MRTVFRNVDAGEARQQAGHDDDGNNDDEFFRGAEHAALNGNRAYLKITPGALPTFQKEQASVSGIATAWRPNGEEIKKAERTRSQAGPSARSRRSRLRGRLRSEKDRPVGEEGRRVGNTRKRVEKR